MSRSVTLLATVVALSLVAQVRASILVSDSGGIGGYGYGYSSWTSMTAALDAASGNTVTVAPNFANLGQMLSFDALWLDQRWTSGSLTATEVANIQAFIATGRRVVMIGENNNWTAWNQQILGIVGGTYNGGNLNGTANAIVNNSITSGVPTINLPAAGDAGNAVGGTALYDLNFATLWGANDNVLTILDVNVFDNINGNAQFRTNVAQWISASSSTVPEPSSLAIFGTLAAGFGLLAGRRRLAATR